MTPLAVDQATTPAQAIAAARRALAEAGRRLGPDPMRTVDRHRNAMDGLGRAATKAGAR